MNLVKFYTHETGDEFDKLVDNYTHLFYGVNHNEFKLDYVVWEAIKNPADGFRSYFKSIKKEFSTTEFFPTPIAYVKVIWIEDPLHFKGYYIVDVRDGHVWLEIGTDYTDDDSPFFIFSYHPKQREQQENYLRLQ